MYGGFPSSNYLAIPSSPEQQQALLIQLLQQQQQQQRQVNMTTMPIPITHQGAATGNAALYHHGSGSGSSMAMHILQDAVDASHMNPNSNHPNNSNGRMLIPQAYTTASIDIHNNNNNNNTNSNNTNGTHSSNYVNTNISSHNSSMLPPGVLSQVPNQYHYPAMPAGSSSSAAAAGVLNAMQPHSSVFPPYTTATSAASSLPQSLNGGVSLPPGYAQSAHHKDASSSASILSSHFLVKSDADTNTPLGVPLALSSTPPPPPPYIVNVSDGIHHHHNSAAGLTNANMMNFNNNNKKKLLPPPSMSLNNNNEATANIKKAMSKMAGTEADAGASKRNGNATVSPPNSNNNNNNNNGKGNGMQFVLGRWYEGVVKRYNPLRGFGFLTGTSMLWVDVQDCERECSIPALMAQQQNNTNNTNHVNTNQNTDNGSCEVLSTRTSNTSNGEDPSSSSCDTTTAAGVAASAAAAAGGSHNHGTVVPSAMQWYLYKQSKLNKLKRIVPEHNASDQQQLGDVFVHHSCISMDGFRVLPIGTVVRFSVALLMGTVQAVDVVPLVDDWWPSSAMSLHPCSMISVLMTSTTTTASAAEEGNGEDASKKDDVCEALAIPPCAMHQAARDVLKARIAVLTDARNATNAANNEHQAEDEEGSHARITRAAYGSLLAVIPSAAIPNTLEGGSELMVVGTNQNQYQYLNSSNNNNNNNSSMGAEVGGWITPQTALLESALRHMGIDAHTTVSANNANNANNNNTPSKEEKEDITPVVDVPRSDADLPSTATATTLMSYRSRTTSLQSSSVFTAEDHQQHSPRLPIHIPMDTSISISSINSNSNNMYNHNIAVAGKKLQNHIVVPLSAVADMAAHHGDPFSNDGASIYTPLRSHTIDNNNNHHRARSSSKAVSTTASTINNYTTTSSASVAVLSECGTVAGTTTGSSVGGACASQCPMRRPFNPHQDQKDMNSNNTNANSHAGNDGSNLPTAASLADLVMVPVAKLPPQLLSQVPPGVPFIALAKSVADALGLEARHAISTTSHNNNNNRNHHQQHQQQQQQQQYANHHAGNNASTSGGLPPLQYPVLPRVPHDSVNMPLPPWVARNPRHQQQQHHHQHQQQQHPMNGNPTSTQCGQQQPPYYSTLSSPVESGCPGSMPTPELETLPVSPAVTNAQHEAQDYSIVSNNNYHHNSNNNNNNAHHSYTPTTTTANAAPTTTTTTTTSSRFSAIVTHDEQQSNTFNAHDDVHPNMDAAVVPLTPFTALSSPVDAYAPAWPSSTLVSPTARGGTATLSPTAAAAAAAANTAVIEGDNNECESTILMHNNSHTKNYLSAANDSSRRSSSSNNVNAMLAATTTSIPSAQGSHTIFFHPQFAAASTTSSHFHQSTTTAAAAVTTMNCPQRENDYDSW